MNENAGESGGAQTDCCQGCEVRQRSPTAFDSVARQVIAYFGQGSVDTKHLLKGGCDDQSSSRVGWWCDVLGRTRLLCCYARGSASESSQNGVGQARPARHLGLPHHHTAGAPRCLG